MWSNLKKLRVTNHLIASVDPQLFKQMNGVEELDLRDNKLESLDFTQHNNIRSLEKIILSNNVLRSIQGLQAFYQLQQLNLANNDLTDVSEFITAQLWVNNKWRDNSQ